jgi:hypothetical protein
MYVKVEPSGCCVRKGMVQVRFCMYLEPTDYGYERHHIEVSVIPENGYPGKVDERGNPIDQKDYDTWLDSLPKIWQNNPFHNHFIQVEPETADKEILDIAGAFLHEAGIKWSTDAKLDLVNNALPFKKPSVIDDARITACETRVQSVKAITVEIKV